LAFRQPWQTKAAHRCNQSDHNCLHNFCTLSFPGTKTHHSSDAYNFGTLVFGREFSSGGHEFSILKAGKKPSAKIFKLNET
jgi:hypothetical protein